MLNTLLLSGYIPPTSDAINFLLGILAFSVLAGLLALWWGVRFIRQDKWVGLLLVLVAVALPVLGWNLLGSIF
jgi:hypothetical protein